MRSSFLPPCRASFLCWNTFPGSRRLEARAACRSSVSAMEMIQGANDTCSQLSRATLSLIMVGEKRKRFYNKELILVSSARLPLEASVDIIGKKGLVPGKLPLFLLKETVWLLLVMAVNLKHVNQRCIWLIVMHNLLESCRKTGIL